MLRVALFFVLFGPLGAGAQTNLACGFSKLPAGASVVVMPADIELFAEVRAIAASARLRIRETEASAFP